MNWFLSALSKLVQATMTDRQVEKIRFIKDFSVLHQDFALHQLESDLGGSRPPVNSFFPFPLCPGPFDRGCCTGPNLNAAQGVHGVLTEEGARGRLWDPAETAEDNVAMEYSDASPAIFRRCNLPMPEVVIKDKRSPFFPNSA